MKALLLAAFAGSMAIATELPEHSALKYDCMIMNLTSDGSKLKFYDHKEVTLVDGQRIILHKHAGLAYTLSAYSLKDGPKAGTGTLEAAIIKESVPLPRGVAANASVGFSGDAPENITAYGWRTRVMSCARVP